MSTRCQVKVEGTNFEPGEALTLYHHCDGYPSNMVPLLAGAYGKDWQHGRVGKAAAYIIATDPGGFEPEAGHALHGDIEWYYVIKIASEGHTKDIPLWNLTVYSVLDEARTVNDMKKVYDGPIEKAVALAESMEETEE